MFQYLGIVFQASRKLTTQVNYATSTAQKSTQTIIKVYRQQAYYILATGKLFTAKTIVQLLCGIQLDPHTNPSVYEAIEISLGLRSVSKFSIEA